MNKRIIKMTKAGIALVMAFFMIAGVLAPVNSGEVEAADQKYYVAVYTTTTPYFTKNMVADKNDGNIPNETQSVYFAVSKDGVNYEVLNSNSGVIFATLGSKRLTSPYIFRTDNGFGVIAANSSSVKNAHVFESNDCVAFRNEHLITLSDTNNVKSAQVVYESGNYTIQWSDGTSAFEASTNDISTTQTLTSASAVYTPDQLEDVAVSGFPEDDNLLLGNALEITEAEYTYIVNKLGKVVNNGLEQVKTLETPAGTKITQETLEKEIPSVNAAYTDGSTQSFAIDWTDALKNVDFSKPGTYTITGNVQQTQYLNNLKEINGSTLPDDDPLNVAPEGITGNFDASTSTVYFDSTKYIANRADPNIYWDEESGYYYMTASYTPTNAEMAAKGTGFYDRVVLRRSETLEGLQDEESEITVWKAGNQPWNNTDTGATGTAYKYIWAPEFHRVGDYYVIYFTESHGGGDYNIYCHALVCSADEDPYTALASASASSEVWTDYVMLAADGDTSQYKSFQASFCLDMTYFQDEVSGKSYVIWAAKPGGNSDLFIAEIDPEQPWKLTSNNMRLSKPEYGWETVGYTVNEGATVLQRDGKIYMCFSASGTGSEYAIGLMTADQGSDLLDISNWTKTPYPLLTSRDVNGEEGPGHNSFTVDEDGNVIFVYHARPTSHNAGNGSCGSTSGALTDPCRHARLKRVHWAADGTPILKMTYDEELIPDNYTVSTTITVKDTTVEVTGVKLSPASKTLNVGSSVKLTAEVLPSNATNKNVTFSVDKPSVVSLSTSGNTVTVKAKAIGTAKVTVKTANGKTASATIVVKNPIKILKLSKTSLKLTKGKTKTLKLTVTPKQYTGKVKWKSTKPAIVKVNQKGKITAKKVGTAYVKVYSTENNKIVAKCKVTVRKKS